MSTAITPTIEVTAQPAQDIPGDDEVYSGTLAINGLAHHLTLIARDDEGQPQSDWAAHTLAAMAQIGGNDKPFRHLDIEGRTYVCVVVPDER